MSYFVDGLNYTLSNEDTRIEAGLMPEGAGEVFAIGGSGARVLPLIGREPRHLKVVDLSDLQLKLVELRLQAARTLTYEEFLFFLGYRGGLQGGSDTGDDRLALFARLNLRPDTRSFWHEKRDQWRHRGFIYLGRWERHFLKLSEIFRSYLRLPMAEIFAAQSLDEQKRLYAEHFRPKLFRSFLRLVASEFVFNRYLYKGHFSGQSGRRSDPRPPWKMIDEEFHRLFQTQLVRKNYFLQMLFLGRVVFEEGLPLEARFETFHAVRNSNTEVTYHATNLLEGLKLGTWDFVSLSDTISYLSDEEMRLLFQRLSTHASPRALVVIRSFLRAASQADVPGWRRRAEDEQLAHGLDGTGVYQFQILERI